MKIEHIAMWVNDIEKMKAFYEKYFNAISGKKYVNPKFNFTSYFLSFDAGCRLEIMHKPALTDMLRALYNDVIGLNHIAISVGARDEVDRITIQLRKDGYEIIGTPRVTGDGYYESIVLDPEKNRLEITV